MIPALGHSYHGVVTPPTVTEQGYTTYTCGTCGDSYVGDYVEALGETYTARFCVPTGVEKIADVLCGKNGIILPEAGVPAGEQNYTFAGWALESVEDTATEPAFYGPGCMLSINNDITFYAVYTYTVGGSGTSEYVLTGLSDIQDDDEVVITVDYNGTVYAMANNNGTSKAPTAVIVAVSGDKLSAAPSDSLKWNMVKASDGYTIHPAGNENIWLYCTNTNNGIRVGTDSAKVFTMQDGYLMNTTYDRFMGVYRTNPDWRTYTSIHANIADEVYGFYVKTAAGTTYYTTLDSAVECEHSNTTDTIVPATCTEPGSVTETCKDCGEVISTESIPATGHTELSYVDNGDGTHDQVCACGEVIIDNEAHEHDAETRYCVCGHRLFKMAGMSVALESYLEVQFLIAESRLQEGYYLEVEHETASGIVTTPITEWGTYQTGVAKFTYTGVAAKQLVDTLYVTIYDANGVQLSVKTPYVVADYLKTLTSGATGKVAVDLLNYGAAAQDFFNYKKDNLANAGLTAEQQALATTDAEVAGYTDNYVKGYGNGTTMEAEYAIVPSVIYSLTKAGKASYARVTYQTAKGAEVSYDIAVEDFADYMGGQAKCAVIEGVAYSSGVNMIAVELFDANNESLGATTYESVASYAVRNQASHAVYLNLLKLVHSSYETFG